MDKWSTTRWISIITIKHTGKENTVRAMFPIVKYESGSTFLQILLLTQSSMKCTKCQPTQRLHTLFYLSYIAPMSHKRRSVAKTILMDNTLLKGIHICSLKLCSKR